MMAEDKQTAAVPPIPFGDSQTQAAAEVAIEEKELQEQSMSMEDHHQRLRELGFMLTEMSRIRFRHEATFYKLCSYGAAEPSTLSEVVIDTLVREHNLDILALVNTHGDLFNLAWQRIGEIADEARTHLVAITQMVAQSAIDNLANMGPAE